MNTFYVLMAVYVVSAILQYRWFQIAYSPKGRWYGCKMERADWMLVFVPLLNTYFCIFCHTSFSPYNNKYK